MAETKTVIFSGWRCDAAPPPKNPKDEPDPKGLFCYRSEAKWGICATPDFVCPRAQKYLKHRSTQITAGVHVELVVTEALPNTLSLRVNGKMFEHVQRGEVVSELDLRWLEERAAQDKAQKDVEAGFLSRIAEIKDQINVALPDSIRKALE